jgi:hypothetical protein
MTISIDAAVDAITDTTTNEVPSDYKVLYESLQAEVDSLKSVISSARLNGVATSQQPADKDKKIAVTADRFRRMVDPVAFLKLTRDEKLTGIGVDPASVTDDRLKALFGRGNSGREAGELFKSSPYRYRQLKEAAEILNLYAA